MKTLESWNQADTAERELLVRCREAVRRIVPDGTLVLFGSRARGDASEESDVDLLVLVERDPNLGIGG